MDEIHKILIMVAGTDDGHRGKYGWSFFMDEKINFSMESPVWTGNGGVRKGDWVCLMDPVYHGKKLRLNAREARELKSLEYSVLRALGHVSWAAFNEGGELVAAGPAL